MQTYVPTDSFASRQKESILWDFPTFGQVVKRSSQCSPFSSSSNHRERVSSRRLGDERFQTLWLVIHIQSVPCQRPAPAIAQQGGKNMADGLETLRMNWDYPSW